MEKTYVPKAGVSTQEWYLVDASGQVLGRLASKIAAVLLGKHDPKFTPGVDIGNYVVVINAERIAVTGKKMEEKMYYTQSLSVSRWLEDHQPEETAGDSPRPGVEERRMGHDAA